MTVIICVSQESVFPHTHTVQLNLNFTHMCRYMRVLARLMQAKLQKWRVHALLHAILACSREIHSKHKRDTRHVHYELALGLPHYTFGVTTGAVAVGNEIQLVHS